MGSGGVLLRVNRQSSQWKYMAVGRVCPKDHCVDPTVTAPGTCDPEHAPRNGSAVKCCDRAYGQTAGCSEDKQWAMFDADIKSMVSQQRADAYNPQWNEVQGLGIGAADMMGIVYPLDGYHANGGWPAPPPAWAQTACEHLRDSSASKSTSWPVFQYSIKLGDDGKVSGDIKAQYKNGGNASSLTVAGHVECKSQNVMHF